MHERSLKILQMAQCGATAKDIAGALGITTSRVYSHVNRYGTALAKAKRTEPASETAKLIIEALDVDLTFTNVAAKFGVSREYVRQIANRWFGQTGRELQKLRKAQKQESRKRIRYPVATIRRWLSDVGYGWCSGCRMAVSLDGMNKNGNKPPRICNICSRTAQGKFRGANPEKVASYRDYRAFTAQRKARGLVFCKNAEWKRLSAWAYTTFGRACLCCGSTRRLNVDHILAVTIHPHLFYCKANLQILCHPCNIAKRQMPIDFRLSKFGDEAREDSIEINLKIFLELHQELG